MGVEPTTYSLGSCHSTTELRPQRCCVLARRRAPVKGQPQARSRRAQPMPFQNDVPGDLQLAHTSPSVRR